MKKLIASLVCLVAALVLVFFFVIPLWDSLSFLKNTLASREGELKQLQERVEKVNRLKKEYQDLESEVQKIFLALPAEEDIPNLLVQFEALAANNGLILDTISFGQLAEKSSDGTKRVDAFNMIGGVEETGGYVSSQSQNSGLRSLNVTMNLAGQYSSFKSYLNALANNIRSMSVESIGFGSSQSSEKHSFNTFNFDLTVSVYYQ